MATVVVVGDGPAGLSAALFLAKNGQDVVVFAQDETAMHYAYLYNYLGIEEIAGTEFQGIARRQVERFGARLREDEVASIGRDGRAFVVHTDGGAQQEADYVILAGARASVTLAQELGADITDGAVTVDANQATSVDRLYAAGRIVRPHRSQAVISAGAGATAALDILSNEAGKDVHDWDTPPE
ncbi:MAG: FAD-dependent oxidoreductase [Actinomycetota bacterium]|nr:FAD-dependent oxidoreductase [Actinomycetota bacterium]